MHTPLIATSVLFGVMALLPVAAQTPPAPSTAPDSKPQSVQAELLTGVKATKAKVNDPVAAHTMTPLVLSDGTVIPVGSKLLGHVVKAEPDSGDRHVSSIAITFESVELKKAKRPLQLSIAAAMAANAT